MSASPFERMDWYETPLYYDIIFDADTKKECDFLEAMYRRYCLTRGKQVLEPACGSGRLLAALAKRGFRVTGFDAHPAMLRYAKRRLHRRKLPGQICPGRMESFRFKRKFDFAYNLVSTFKYLSTENDARCHLECVADALKPSGVYVLGFHLTDYDDDRKQRERWTGARANIRVVCNIQSWPPDPRKRTERVRSRLTVERRGEVRKHETTWWFRTYNARQFRSLLGTIPNLEHVATYDFSYDVDGPRSFNDDQTDCIVVLRRRP